LIDSEEFQALRYEIKDKHVVIKGGGCGTLAMALENVEEFARELMEIGKAWKEVRT